MITIVALWVSFVSTFLPVSIAEPLAKSPAVILAQTSIPRSHGSSSMEVVQFPNAEAPGTIIISNDDLTLHRVIDSQTAERYKISVGKPGAIWTGVTYVGMKREWPSWRPTASMRARNSRLPEYVPPGPLNPMGARALYLFSDGRDTLYRIHGTATADTVGTFETAGCFRMTNRDVIDIFERVAVGTKVIVR